MRLSKLGFMLCAQVAFFASAPLAQAQPTNTNIAPPPPQLEPLEEGEAPSVTISTPQEGAQPGAVTQKRAPGGRVTETKVTKGKSTYYVLPNDPAGSAARGDMEANTNRAPQWEVLNFDFRSNEETKKATAEAAAGTPMPPAPPVPSPTKK